MTIEQKIYEIWIADATATALVPGPRIKPPGNWQSLSRPYIIHFPVAENPIQVHNGYGARVALNQWPFYQFSVFADSYSSGLSVAVKIQQVFNGNIGGVQFLSRGQRWSDRDDRVNIEHFVVDFQISESL